MTKEMSPGEHLKLLYRTLEEIRLEIDDLVQQVTLLNQRVKRLEELADQMPTWPLDRK